MGQIGGSPSVQSPAGAHRALELNSEEQIPDEFQTYAQERHEGPTAPVSPTVVWVQVPPRTAGRERRC